MKAKDKSGDEVHEKMLKELERRRKARLRSTGPYRKSSLIHRRRRK